MRRTGWLALAVAIAIVASGCSGGGGGSNAAPASATITGMRGDVRLVVPGGAEAPNTKVVFRSAPSVVSQAPVAGVEHAIPVMAPIDVHVGAGELARDRVRVTLKLPAGRPAGVYQDAFLAVYEPQLGAFVPLLDSQADPKTRTVTAIAPHFSVYDAFVNSAKKVTGKLINWGDLLTVPWLRLIPSVNKAVQGIQQEAVDSLFGFSSAVTCSPPSSKIKVKVHDATHGQLLEACAQDYSDISGRVYVTVGNHYGFPILYAPPSGFTVGLRDFDFENGTPLDLVRHLLWMEFNDVEAPGAGNARFTLQPGTRLPATIDGNMDWGAVTVDMAYYFASVVVPQLAEMSPELKATLEEIVSGILEADSNGKVGVEAFKESAEHLVEKAGSTAESVDQVLTVLDIGECAYDAYKASPELTKGGVFSDISRKSSTVLKVAFGCVRNLAYKLGSDEVAFVDSIAQDLKAFPELAESKIAENLSEVGVKVTRSSVTVTNIGPPAPVLPSGTIYGYISHVGMAPNSVTFDQVQWFFGKSAMHCP